MPVFKWSMAFIVIILPLSLLLSDYVGHSTTKEELDHAAYTAAQYAIKNSVVVGSLRDLDVEPTQLTIDLNEQAIVDAFESSFTRTREGALLSIAGTYDPVDGYITNPPVIAIRANVVRKSHLQQLLSNFMPISERYVLQTQQVSILEMIQTTLGGQKYCYEYKKICNQKKKALGDHSVIASDSRYIRFLEGG
jgi:hypothetical protein